MPGMLGWLPSASWAHPKCCTASSVRILVPNQQNQEHTRHKDPKAVKLVYVKGKKKKDLPEIQHKRLLGPDESEADK